MGGVMASEPTNRDVNWRRVFLLSSCLVLTAVFSAVVGDRYRLVGKVLAKLSLGDFAAIRADQATTYRDDSLERPARMSCPKQDQNTMVAVLLGQSNAANFAEVKTAAIDPRITVFYHG